MPAPPRRREGRRVDLNTILIWVVAVSAGLALARIAWARAASARGWAVALGLVLLALGAAAALAPGVAGYVGAAAWLVLVLAPAFGERALLRLGMRQEFGKARRLADWLRLLHPASGWRERPLIFHALELAQAGRFAEAEALCRRLGADDSPLGRLAALQLFRLTGDWAGLRGFVEDRLARGGAPDPNLVASYLRALGETGDSEGVVRAYAHFEAWLDEPAVRAIRPLCQLELFAFSGRTDLLARLFEGPLAQYPPAMKDLWIATAELAAGREAAARERLARIAPGADPLTARAVERRLERGVARAAAGEVAAGVLSRAERALEEEERYGPRGATAEARRARATHVLVAANVAFFVIELLQGGSRDLRTLFRLGALVPRAVLAGEWARVLAANFLHFGLLHLAMNMIGLMVLGPFVEGALGRLRFVVTYLASGVLALGAIVLLARAGVLPEDDLLVGASACVMGLVGASGAVLFRGWRMGARTAGRRLGRVVLIIVLQAAFDLSTPEVSFTAHLAGAIAGFLVGYAIEPRRRPRVTLVLAGRRLES
jgi:rhomboid protease GluP